jgi:Uma2 family endonuclease
MERLGGVPAYRILAHFAPGTATEQDALSLLEAANKRVCELVDGMLVEKVMATHESVIAGLMFGQILNFVRKHKLGKVLPGDGGLRLLPGLVRFPDVSFISGKRIPHGIPRTGFAAIAPNLAVEVISKGNTKGEMQRKLRDYFLAGVEVVWYVYPKTGTAMVYQALGRKKRIGKKGSLDGGDVLPGFKLSLRELFAEAE